jgi:hypothetical protein
VAAHIAFPPPWTAEQGLERFKTADDRPSTVYKVTSSSPYELEVDLDYGDNRPWNAVFEVARVEPHRIVRMFWSRAIPDDIVIRPAAADDSAALNDLEVRAPMRLGPTTVTYDRGEDFLGFARLMGEPKACESEGQTRGALPSFEPCSTALSWPDQVLGGPPCRTISMW